jgi:Amt family ammonium transporter
LGVLDFAGGNVVEINSGISGLVAAIVIGKRKSTKPEPHHIPLAVLGGGLLWFGWFGFNAGSTLAINGIAVNAFLTTNTAAAAGALSWVVCDLIFNKKPTVLGVISGSLAGLVSITQGAGYVSPLSAVIIGLFGGILSFVAIGVIKAKFGYDDTLDAFGCHGIGGLWGAVATGIFASKTVNPSGADGLIYGNAHLLVVHIIAAFSCAAFAAAGTFAILKIMSLFMKLRTDEEDENIGLDVSLHGEEAYSSIPLEI